IILFLLLAYRSVQHLQARIAVRPALGLAFAMFCIYYLRGYIFYVALGPILLSLTSRKSDQKQAFYNQLAGIILLGIGFVASGLANTALAQLQDVTLQDVSKTRRALALEANSGIDKDADISTPGKALAYLPKGLSYF